MLPLGLLIVTSTLEFLPNSMLALSLLSSDTLKCISKYSKILKSENEPILKK